MKKLRKKHFLNENILFILGTIFVFALISGCVVIFLYNSSFSGSLTSDHIRWGTFGDFFGGILNPIFSFLALLALLLTIIIQNKELSLSTIEFSKSASALADQSKSLKIQNFEMTFFSLLRTHNEIVNSIDLHKKGLISKTGRDCFKTFYKYLKSKCQYAPNVEEKYELEHIRKLYTELYKDRLQSDTGHYFLFLYNIIKFIDNSDIENKRFYTNLIRAQLSYDELGLLFYNCISIPEENKFKPLIEKFGIFKNLPKDALINEKKHLQFYNDSAYL